MLCAVGGIGDGIDAYIVTSSNAVAWTERANPKYFDLVGVAWSPSLSMLVACGNIDTGLGYAYLIRSADGGASWAQCANPQAQNLRGIAWGAGRFVAVGSAGYIVTSSNGFIRPSSGCPLDTPPCKHLSRAHCRANRVDRLALCRGNCGLPAEEPMV